MKPVALMAVSAAIVVSLFALTARRLSATTETTALPTGGTQCLLSMYSCTYPGSVGYWDGCDPNLPPSWVSTLYAKVVCTNFHSGDN